MERKSILATAVLILIFNLPANSQSDQTKMSFKKYIEANLPAEEEIDVFLSHPSWVQFDAEVGYILGNFMPHDGMDSSRTISTVQDDGSRTSFMYKGDTCRINTYGNSFTAGNQVNDGETWQEYLAAHLGEPIRNFGVGGFGVYQSYRRMIREENTDRGAKYNILYIWGDDHFRSLLRSRYMVTTSWNERQDIKEGVGTMFHGNFWSNLEMDLERGIFVEKENLLPTRESLYKMCDVEWMHENLKGDLALQMRLYIDHRLDTINMSDLLRLSDILDFKLFAENEKILRASIEALLDKYSYAATRYILLKASEFSKINNKELMVVLFDPYGTTRQLLKKEVRGDQEIVDFLEEQAINYFDMNLVHVEDYKSFNLEVDAYYNRYFIGHYNPVGNHFFAYSIKNKLINWLDPKPFPYLNTSGKSIDFQGYLKNYKMKK